MGVLSFIGAAVVALIGVTSAIAGLVTLWMALTQIEDANDKFLVIYALLGWFVIGLCIASLL